MSISLVKEYLSQWGRDKDVLEFPVSSATVELAAQALSTEPKRIAKSLSFADGDDACIIVVLAGDAKANSGKFKRAFGTKGLFSLYALFCFFDVLLFGLLCRSQL